VPDVSAPLAARRALNGLASHVDHDVIERSGLVVSEVMTNSIKHAGLMPHQRIDLQVSVLSEVLRIEVTDEGLGFEPVAVKPGPERTSGGWGLWLVDQLTDRWGVDFDHSTRVWFEFDTAAN
jgi:anti-sigma regulatory factor (Ser/Thr protein kinase)